MPRVPLEEAYPGIEFLPNSRNWWAKLKGTPPECIHLRDDHPWIATLVPDTLYLRGKKAGRREPQRPEVMLCLDCLKRTAESEIASYPGLVVAFEPDPDNFSQYFFLTSDDFAAAGVAPEVGDAIRGRLEKEGGECSECPSPALWVWFSREDVFSLDEVDRIREVAGQPLCAAHGSGRLWRTFGEMKEASVYYMNLPYGESGAYVWI